MRNDNPYAAPSANGRVRTPRFASETTGTTAFFLTLALPIAILWELAAWRRLVRPLPMDELWFNVTYTMLIFGLSFLAIPLAIAGLRSSRGKLAGVALLVGAIEVSVIYIVKFHPWVMRFIS